MPRFFFALLFLSFFSTAPTVAFAGRRCTGSAGCTACTNCSGCAHCSSGGTCGVCSGGSASSRPARKSRKAKAQPAYSEGESSTPAVPKAVKKKTGRQTGPTAPAPVGKETLAPADYAAGNPSYTSAAPTPTPITAKDDNSFPGGLIIAGALGGYYYYYRRKKQKD